RMQHGAQRMPRDLPVRPELRHDLVEPDVGGLQSLVENVEVGGAHVVLPMIATAVFGERTLPSSVPEVPTRDAKFPATPFVLRDSRGATIKIMPTRRPGGSPFARDDAQLCCDSSCAFFSADRRGDEAHRVA